MRKISKLVRSLPYKKFGMFIWKYLFPNYHKKITYSVLALGSGVLADGFFDGLIKWGVIYLFSLITNQSLPNLADSSSNGQIYGVALVFLALTYSFSFSLLETFDSKWRSEVQTHAARNMLKRDQKLYEEIKKTFGTNSLLARFVLQQNFLDTWSKTENDALNEFVYHYDIPEKRFLSDDLADRWNPLFGKLASLSELIAAEASFLAGNMSRCGIFDPGRHHDFNIPQYIIDAGNKANCIGREISVKHKEFVAAAEERFGELEQS